MSKDARVCFIEAIRAQEVLFPLLKKDERIRQIGNALILTLSGTGNVQCETWDDVRDMVKEGVEVLTPDSLVPIKKNIEEYFLGAVDKAKEINHVFIQPKPL